MGILVTVSILFFYRFLEITVTMCVESQYYIHTNNIVSDMMQVKQNDFALSMNELVVSARFFVDLIENRRFNKKSLGGPDLDNVERFKKYSQSMLVMLQDERTQEEHRRKAEDGKLKPPYAFPENKVTWFVNLNFTKDDLGSFHDQVLRRLRGQSKDDSFEKLTQRQIDDIIVCAASIFMRGDYALNHEYTDLQKIKNFIGFESGVICFYPNFYPDWSTPKGYGCEGNSFFIKTYMDNSTEGHELSYYFDKDKGHYDPRCRGWYENQYRKNHTTLNNVYRFSFGHLGTTTCAPLWGRQKFYGAYCMDFYPNSIDSARLIDYFYEKNASDNVHTNYLLFTPDEEFLDEDYMGSQFKMYLQDMLFTSSRPSQSSPGTANYTVTSISVTHHVVDALQKHLNRFAANYNMSLVSPPPTAPVTIAVVSLRNNETGQVEEQSCFINNFNVSQLPMDYPWLDKDDVEGMDLKFSYKFTLCMPSRKIKYYVDKVRSQVERDLMDQFVIPLAIVSLVVAMVVIYMLVKMSTETTKPIIQLYQKIR